LQIPTITSLPTLYVVSLIAQALERTARMSVFSGQCYDLMMPFIMSDFFVAASVTQVGEFDVDIDVRDYIVRFYMRSERAW
jgi:hypothetical protein